MPELLGFTPDRDPRTPGAILAGSAFVPTIRGVSGAPSPADVGVSALDAPSLGAVSSRVLSGARRTISGTNTKLQELTGLTWTDRSKALGYATSGGRWRFTQFGDVTIATNRSDPIQASSPGAAFDDLSGALGAFTGATSDNITITGHTLAVNDRITFAAAGSTLPVPIVAGTVYWVKTIATDIITISTTQGGATLDITVAGGGRAYKVVSQPKARFIDTVGLFVVAADTIDTLFGDQPDRWWCSALGDHTNWVPSIATQSASGRILDAEGPITASRGLGNSWIIYKKNAIYVGSYVGGDVIWAFERVPGDVGCVSHDSIINLQSAHVFRGQDDFYVFDGNRAGPIGVGSIKEFIGSKLSSSFESRVTGLQDKANSLIYYFYPGTGSTGNPDSCLIYNYESKKWGVQDISIQAVTEIISGQLIWDTLGTIAPTWNDFPNVAYDDPFWVSGKAAPGIFDTNNKLLSLSGPPATASITTWELGETQGYLGISRVLPRFRGAYPATGTMVGRYVAKPGQAFQSAAPRVLVDGGFSYLRTAVLHQFMMDFPGAFEMVDLGYE